MSGARKRPAPAAAEPSLFEGCSIAFWRLHHVQRMKERVQALGGRVDAAPCAGTTHLAIPADMSRGAAEQVAARCGGGVECVTSDWVTQTILKRKRQAEADFRPLALAAAPPAPEPPDPEAPPGPDGGTAPQERPQDGTSGSTAPFSTEELQSIYAGAERGSPPPPPPQPPQQQQQQQAAVLAPPAAAPPGSPAEAEPPPGAAGQPCVVERRCSEFVAVRGSLPRFTGGHTGIRWGTGGVWAEPYDEDAARQTLATIRRFWFSRRASATPAAGGADAGAGDSDSDRSRSASPGPSPAGAGNGVCAHAACCRRPFCLLEKLGEVKALYHEGRDQFKIRAMNRALSQLTQCSYPLDRASDVDRLGLGAKSAEKVKELLTTGASARVEAAAHDEQRRILRGFHDVWGAGTATADRWYRDGCRTLADVAARGDLTEQQRCGVAHYEDFKVRIPAAEVRRAEGIVRGVVFDVAEARGVRREELQYVYCAAAGSYSRGAPDSSDIDMLMGLPPCLDGIDVGVFLREVLARLLALGFLVDELEPTRPRKPRFESVTFLGVCHPPPGGAHVRRIDFKVYPSKNLAMALNYFANGQEVCRATRHYANHGVPALAAAHNPGATGFKLTDREMVPMRTVRGAGGGSGSGGRASVTVTMEPPLDITCETDIFEAIGLAFIPPHMRKFE